MSEHKPSSRSIIRVGIADKSPLIQAALTHLFAEDDRFELVNMSSDSETFLQLYDQFDMQVAVIGWMLAPISFISTDERANRQIWHEMIIHHVEMNDICAKREI